MCGIAGRVLRGVGKVGEDLVHLMAAQAHRGADSTGFAVYGVPREDGYIVRAMGFDQTQLHTDLDDFRKALQACGSDFLEDPSCTRTAEPHYSVRLVIKDPDNLAHWVHTTDAMADRLEVQSVGRSLEIVKDTGDAVAVADKHDVWSMQGTHGLGHARLATESSVLPNASHPFLARPFADVAIVHNGQITDYFTQRDRLERAGYRFMTQNDSELIAVWVSDQMRRGLTKAQALEKSIGAIDGVFTFLITDIDSMGFAKDRFAMKPLVTVERNGEMTAGTEEQSVRRIHTGEVDVINYDGPGITRLWRVHDLRTAA